MNTMKDREKLPAWLRDAAHEIENAHRVLDDIGAQDESDDGTPLTLAARIAAFFDRLQAAVDRDDE